MVSEIFPPIENESEPVCPYPGLPYSRIFFSLFRENLWPKASWGDNSRTPKKIFKAPLDYSRLGSICSTAFVGSGRPFRDPFQRSKVGENSLRTQFSGCTFFYSKIKVKEPFFFGVSGQQEISVEKSSLKMGTLFVEKNDRQLAKGLWDKRLKDFWSINSQFWRFYINFGLFC